MLPPKNILHLSVKAEDILPDYLRLMPNAPIVKIQAERDAGGSTIQYWRLSEVAQVLILIPILSEKIQQKLPKQLSKSFALRKEAATLLKQIQQLVEQIIEQAEYS